MATKKKTQTAYLGGYVPAKQVKGDVMAGYISTNAPTSPDLQRDQFGTTQSVSSPLNAPTVSNIPTIVYNIVRGYTESNGIDATVYTLSAGKILIVTSIQLSATNFSLPVSVVADSEALVYAHKKNGNIDLIGFLALPRVADGVTMTTINPVVPLAFNPEIYDYIFIRPNDGSCRTRIFLLGYEIVN